MMRRSLTQLSIHSPKLDLLFYFTDKTVMDQTNQDHDSCTSDASSTSSSARVLKPSLAAASSGSRSESNNTMDIGEPKSA